MYKKDKLVAERIWIIPALLILSAVILISIFSPYIPDYDGLAYFDTAKTIHQWLFTSHDFYLRVSNIDLISKSTVPVWPLTNGISVYITAIFLDLINANYIPILINSLYLFAFLYYIKEIRSTKYAIIAVLLLCSHTLFFRLFTTLTSEFSVGLWIYAFLLTLTSNHPRRGIYLTTLTIIGLLLRTIDIIFILMATSAYLAIHFGLWRDKKNFYSTFRYVILTLLLTSPIFFLHYKGAFEYVYSTSFGLTAESWKSLAGTSNRYELFFKYIQNINFYNSIIIPLTAFSLILVFYFRPTPTTIRSLAIIIGTAFSTCLPLFLASSLNIQVVFWIYSTIIFILCETSILLYPKILEYKKNSIIKTSAINYLFITLITINALFLLAQSWSQEVTYLKKQKFVSDISFKISNVLELEQGTPTIAANFRGVGALDILGLSFNRRNKFIYGGIDDIYSKNKNPTDYLNLKESTNFFLTAHENYFFAPHFGINDHIKETHEIFSKKSSELGFRKIQEISHDGRKVDIWYKPSAHAYPQYINFNDKWISWKMPLQIGTKD
jgi:hypothetical protein